MSLLDKVVDIIYKEERTIKSPQFIKDFSKDNKQINDLEQLANELKSGYKRDLVIRDLAFLKKGIEGENNAYFELNNSFLPILCLHDIRLEYKGYVAQYDFIVISDKFICVLETKSLNGNIIVDSQGNFIRVFLDKNGKEIRREGMYSPVVQNERHLSILKEVLREKELLGEMLYLSYVVIANPKTIIHKKNCPPNIDKAVIKHDQIISTLKYHQEKSTYHKLEKYLFDIAFWLKQNDRPIEIDYISKYKLTKDNFPSTVNNEVALTVDVNQKSIEQLCEELKKYRLTTSKKENVPAYYIFSNEEMDRLIEKYPTNEKELLEVKGFGKIKVEKYGRDILKIFMQQ